MRHLTVVVASLVLLAVFGASPAAAGPVMAIDAPVNGSTVPQPFWLAGWAIDTNASSGTGVDALHVWGYPNPGSGAPPVFLGVASYGNPRTDVGAIYGSQFTNSGYFLLVTGQLPGVWTIVVYAHSGVTGTFNQERQITVTFGANPQMSIDTPTHGTAVQQPFVVAGWAIDYAAAAGTGVDAIHVWAFPGSGAPAVFLGVATYGGSRPDVGDVYGSHFTNSGYGLIVAGQPPGDYQIVVFARSTVTWTFNQAQTVTVSVDPQVATPAFSPPAGTYTGWVPVSLSTATTGATVYWTQDGSEPTTASAVYTSSLWYGPGATVTLKAKAFKAGWLPSGTATASYIVNVDVVPAPTATPPAGMYNIGQGVTLTVSDPMATIRYTRDGTDPSESSAPYSSPLVFNEPATLKARAFRAGYTPSAVLTSVYAIRVAKPTMTPAGGEFDTAPSVEASTSTVGATIRFTTNGEEPTATSPVYSARIQTSGDTTIKAIALKDGWANSDVAVDTYITAASIYLQPSSGTVVASSSSSGALQSVGSSVRFNLSGAQFDLSSPVLVSVNGNELDTAQVYRTTYTVDASGALLDGKNVVQLAALDTTGLPINSENTFWAGSRNFSLDVLRPDGSRLVGATVSVEVCDGPPNLTMVTDSNGRVSWTNMPAGALTLVASAPGYVENRFVTDPAWTSAWMSLSLDDNNFEQSGAGWAVSADAGNAAVQAHEEGTFTWYPCPTCPIRSGSVASPQSLEAAPSGQQQSTDLDLSLQTARAVSPQTATRYFWASEGATSAEVRYRFASTEFFETPNPANDWYTVRITNQTTTQSISDSRNVFTLWGQVGSAGQTAWLTLSVLARPYDLIRVDATVANAVDNAHVSVLQVDRAQESRVYARSFQLHDKHYRENQRENLQFLSASTHPAYNGNTEIYGTLDLRGPVSDSLTDLWLEFRSSSGTAATVARAVLAQDARPLVLRPFDGAGRISITTSRALFVVEPAQLAVLQASSVDSLSAWISGRTAANRVLEPKLYAIRLPRLFYYRGANAAADNDLADCVYPQGWVNRLGPAFDPPHPCGGGVWARPNVVTWAPNIDATLTDFSNMNGARFPIHASHREGLNTDGSFTDFVRRDKAVANRLIAIVRTNYRRIRRVLVTHERDPLHPSAFFRALLEADANPLPDGRLLSSVIINWPGHTNHFHINWRPTEGPQ